MSTPGQIQPPAPVPVMVEVGAGHQVLPMGGHFLLHQNGLRVLTPLPAHREGMTAAATASSVTQKPCPVTLFSKKPMPRDVSELKRRLKSGEDSGCCRGSQSWGRRKRILVKSPGVGCLPISKCPCHPKEEGRGQHGAPTGHLSGTVRLGLEGGNEQSEQSAGFPAHTAANCSPAAVSQAA